MSVMLTLDEPKRTLYTTAPRREGLLLDGDWDAAYEAACEERGVAYLTAPARNDRPRRARPADLPSPTA